VWGGLLLLLLLLMMIYISEAAGLLMHIGLIWPP
jgi:hypothetical protein